jgi:prepilin-type N-terminal cleavage/methylation domain-containing protein
MKFQNKKVNSPQATFSLTKSEGGFTLIEILLVIALIALLAGIVIIAVNPAKQLADGRNSRRKADVNTIMNAIYQYAIDNGSMPASLRSSNDCLSSGANDICRTSASDCSNLTDLSVLTTDQKYLPSIPADPQVTTGNDTGYYVVINPNNRVIVCAPQAENGETISVIR